MSYDKAVDSEKLNAAMTATADAIRYKAAQSDLIQWNTLTGFSAAILSIPVEVDGIALNVINSENSPTNPFANLLWIKADAAISGYRFSKTAPSEAVEGLVWFCTEGTNPTITVNIGENEEVELTITDCKQYINGSFQTIYCAVYNGEQWDILWNGYVYDKGTTYEHITGGFTTKAIIPSSYSVNMTPGKPSMKYNNATFTATSQDGKGGMFHTVDKVDLTGWDILAFAGTFTRGGSVARNVMIGIWDDIEDYYQTSAAAFTNITGETGSFLTLDVSSYNGLYYIGMGLTDASKAVVEMIYLAKAGA